MIVSGWIRSVGFVASAVVVGCGHPDYAEVTGRVLLDGRPVEGAFVEFIPSGGRGGTSYGKTDSGGSFRMRRSAAQSGVHKGRCLIRIHTGDSGRGPGEQVAERIPDAYHDRSKLTCDVVDTRHAFLFELSSHGSPAEPRRLE